MLCGFLCVLQLMNTLLYTLGAVFCPSIYAPTQQNRLHNGNIYSFFAQRHPRRRNVSRKIWRRLARVQKEGALYVHSGCHLGVWFKMFQTYIELFRCSSGRDVTLIDA